MRLRLAVFLLIVLTASALTVSARSGGPPADTVKQQDGCSCHGSANTATTIHDLKGWPTSYVPGQQYILEVSSTNNLQPRPTLTSNQGGFLAWVTKGDLTTTPGTQAWIDPGKMSTGESWVRHNIQGETENGQQRWNFTWTAPAAGAGDVTIHVYVNRINSDGGTTGDHWNKRSFTAKQGSGTPTSVFPPPSDTTASTGPSGSWTGTAPRDGTNPVTSSHTEPWLGFVAGAAVLGSAAVFARRRVK